MTPRECRHGVPLKKWCRTCLIRKVLRDAITGILMGLMMFVFGYMWMFPR